MNLIYYVDLMEDAIQVIRMGICIWVIFNPQYSYNPLPALWKRDLFCYWIRLRWRVSNGHQAINPVYVINLMQSSFYLFSFAYFFHRSLDSVCTDFRSYQTNFLSYTSIFPNGFFYLFVFLILWIFLPLPNLNQIKQFQQKTFLS